MEKFKDETKMSTALTPVLGEAIAEIWSDDAIRKVYHDRHKYTELAGWDFAEKYVAHGQFRPEFDS